MKLIGISCLQMLQIWPSCEFPLLMLVGMISFRSELSAFSVMETCGTFLTLTFAKSKSFLRYAGTSESLGIRALRPKLLR